MKISKYTLNVKYAVIVGYILVIIVMIMGLISIYRNLVQYSEKKIKNEDLAELLIVGNTLSKLYEIESSQNLFNVNLTQNYFLKYDSILPHIKENIYVLKRLSTNETRRQKLDTILLLLEQKKQKVQEISLLLDSLKEKPLIIHEIQNSYVPKALNKKIRDYLKNKSKKTEIKSTEATDTTIVKKKKKGFLSRVRNVFNPKEDTLVIIKGTSPLVERESYKTIIDTVIKMVKHSERFDLTHKRKVQQALFTRQLSMNYMNTMLTSRINDLLKGIENEEIQKSVQLLSDKSKALNNSQRKVYLFSWIALIIALFFGLFFMININRIQRYRKRLEKSNNKIRQLLELRERLMLFISHDIKAPMSSILGYIELMLPPINEEKKILYLNNMKKSSEHALQLVTNLLDYHRLKSKKWTFKRVNFNVHELIENTIDSFRPLAEQKELQYIIDNKIEKEFCCYGDPYLLRQVLSNLISNAIKFTNKGQVRILAEVKTIKNKQQLIIKVADTGIGISEKEKQYIFREFMQSEKNKTFSYAEGSGLGLAIVKGLILEIGGLMVLDSEEGKGSEFMIELPLKPAKKENKATSLVQGKKTAYNVAEDISVLFVDDDKVQLTMMKDMLRTKKIKVKTEYNPLTVVEILKNNKYDIIFIDIQMPILNGFVLVNNIRELDIDYAKTIPIIALSAKSGISNIDLKEAGFSGFMTKPFSSDQLFFTISHYVNNIVEEKLNKSHFKNKSIKVGVGAIIEFVKDDKDASLEILRTFVNDNQEDIEKLKKSFEEFDQTSSAHYAHKMLPLFRMIGNEELIAYLSNLEGNIQLPSKKQQNTLKLLEKYMQEARELISDIERK